MSIDSIKYGKARKSCQFCHQIGHVYSDCPNMDSKDDEILRRERGTCFLCHKKGHLFENCPNMDGDTFTHGVVHIKIHPSAGTKQTTTVQGIGAEYDLKKIVQEMKNLFHCCGSVVKHPQYGGVIQLTSDQREKVKKYLGKAEITVEESCIIHGF